MKPNKENLLRWVKALESGRYVQTQSHLRGEVINGEEVKMGYCCLGVACDVAAEDVDGRWSGNKFIAGPYDDEHTSHLPKEVADWLGIKFREEGAGNVMLMFGGAMTPATNLNDVHRMPFNRIAELVRERFNLGAKGAD